MPAGCRPEELCALAESVAREAGALVHAGRPERVEVAATKSSPTDVVTQMDRASEDLIRERLRQARPQDAMLGEERGAAPLTPGGAPSGQAASGQGRVVTWVVDPIDGTVNYLYGIPVFAVCVAAVVGDPSVPGGWAPVAGCVHNPATGRTWTAQAGGGAWLDGHRLTMPEPPALEAALVATGFGYVASRRAAQADVVRSLLPRVRDLRRLGSASIDLCMLASGQLDAYYERGLHAWDMAAAALVVLEAGGRVVGIDGIPPQEHMVVAAAEPLCRTLATALEELGAANDG